MKVLLTGLVLSAYILMNSSIVWADSLELKKQIPVRVTLDNEYSKSFDFNYITNGEATVLLRMIEKVEDGFLGKLRRYHYLQAGESTVTERLQSGRYIAELTYLEGNSDSVRVSGKLSQRPVQ